MDTGDQTNNTVKTSLWSLYTIILYYQYPLSARS